MIDTYTPAASDKLPAITLNTPPMSVLEPTDIAMLPPKPDADEPLAISKAPLLLMLAVQVFINRSPNTLAVPALLVDTAMLPMLVAMPTPDEMVTEPPKAILPSPPLIVTAPPLVLPSPEARVELLPLLVAYNLEMIDASFQDAPNKLPVITLNALLMLVPEPTEIAQTSHSQRPRRHCCLPFQSLGSMIDHSTCLLFLHYSLIRPHFLSLWPCQCPIKW
jgi:hypothetical protein